MTDAPRSVADVLAAARLESDRYDVPLLDELTAHVEMLTQALRSLDEVIATLTSCPTPRTVMTDLGGHLAEEPCGVCRYCENAADLDADRRSHR